MSSNATRPALSARSYGGGLDVRHSLLRVAALRRLVSLGSAKARDGAAVVIQGAGIEVPQNRAVEDIRQILLPQHQARSFAVPASGKRGLDRRPRRGIATVFAIGAIAP